MKILKLMRMEMYMTKLKKKKPMAKRVNRVKKNKTFWDAVKKSIKKNWKTLKLLAGR